MHKLPPPHAAARALLWACLAAWLCLGCAATQPRPAEQKGPLPIESLPDLQAAYTLAVDSYLAGGYEKAADLFQQLAATRTDPLLAHKAFFGLACAKLALARNEEELNRALALWNDWAQMPSQGQPYEDPRMLGPLLVRLSAALPEAAKAAAAKPARKPNHISGPLPEQGMDRFRGQVNALEENARLKEQLRKRAVEIEALRDQLKALERLHQELTLKKKDLE